MYGINSDPPKNCLYCPLCQGEYGPGNEKSYCAIKPKVKLKYKGYRPKECPIIKVRLQEEITNDDIQQAIKEGFANGYEMAKSKYERPQGEWIKHIDNLYPEDSTEECPFCHEEQTICGNDDNFCPNCGADMRKGGKE